MHKRLVRLILWLGMVLPLSAFAKVCEDDLQSAKLDVKVEAAKAWALIEDFWGREFKKVGRNLSPSTLVLFNGWVNTRCGRAHEKLGPFYCPLDNKTYVPTSFWPLIERGLGKDSEAARLMVLAHEYGHHIMTLLRVQVPILSMIFDESSIQSDSLKVFSESLADALAGYFAAHMSGQGRLTQVDQTDLNKFFENIGDDKLHAFLKLPGRRSECNGNPHGCGRERLESFLVGFRASNFREVLENRYQNLERDPKVSEDLKEEIHYHLFGGGPWWPIVRSGI